MRQKENETTADPLTPEELTELQKLLQTDNIAPVDRMTFGRRLAEIIIRVRKIDSKTLRCFVRIVTAWCMFQRPWLTVPGTQAPCWTVTRGMDEPEQRPSYFLGVGDKRSTWSESRIP